MPPPGVDELLVWLEAPDGDISWAAARQLAGMGERRAIEPLLSMLERCLERAVAEPSVAAEDRHCRGTALALAAFREPRAFEGLVRLLRDGRGLTRKNAATALGVFGDVRARGPLIEVVVADTSRPVRHAAILALARLHDARAIELLLGEFADRDQNTTAAEAAQALGEMGEVALQPLLDALRDADSRVHFQAITGLESLGDARAFDAVQSLATNDPDGDVQRRAGIVAKRLRRTRPRRARPPGTRRSPIEQHFEIFAEYHQFYIGDPGFAARTDPTQFMNQEAMDRRLAVDPPGLIGVLTASEFDVPVTVRLVDRRPGEVLETWDHVVEASLQLTGDFLTIGGPTGYDLEDGPHMQVGPGTYRVRVSTAHLGPGDDEQYEVVLWPEAPYQPPRVLKSL